MIKEREITINITSRNVNTYIQKYKCKVGDEISIKIEDVNKNSKLKITAICKICGSENIISIEKYYRNYKRSNYYGCRLCSRIKMKKTSLEKYGEDNYMKCEDAKERVSKNNLKKYGVKTTLLVDSVKKKIRKTNKKKYGVEEPLSSDIIRNKSKKTLMKKYGVEHFSKSKQFQIVGYNRWKKEILEKLKKYNIQDFKLKEDRTVDIKCDLQKKHYFNINSKNLYQRKEIQNAVLCTECNILSVWMSGKELELLNFIKENYKGVIIENDKNILNGKELDVYLPELNIAFEFNGIYWHSDLYKYKNYHKEKSDLCEEKSIQLIHIWENDWAYKQNIVKSMILNKLGKTPNKIFARKTEVKEIDNNKLIKEFLNKNHIQGFVGSSVKLGLFYENELVSLMTFGKKRKSQNSNGKNGEFELLRFCNKVNTNVVGGASKLFKYFIRNKNFTDIITYADRSHSNGNLYKELGFTFSHKTEPGYSYYDKQLNKFNRFNFRKDLLVSEGYDLNKTEFQIMNERGFLRVFNSGNFKYLFEF